jgi:hypothetical protein
VNILRKLTRQQYQQFIEDYYHGRLGTDIAFAFIKSYTQVDDPLLFSGMDEGDLLDHIEKNYVEPEQLAA